MPCARPCSLVACFFFLSFMCPFSVSQHLARHDAYGGPHHVRGRGQHTSRGARHQGVLPVNRRLPRGTRATRGWHVLPGSSARAEQAPKEAVAGCRRGREFCVLKADTTVPDTLCMVHGTLNIGGMVGTAGFQYSASALDFVRPTLKNRPGMRQRSKERSFRWLLHNGQ